jgi:hypothetical protein
MVRHQLMGLERRSRRSSHGSCAVSRGVRQDAIAQVGLRYRWERQFPWVSRRRWTLTEIAIRNGGGAGGCGATAPAVVRRQGGQTATPATD